MADVFAEVDEVMRQEKMAKFWHENKVFIIGFIAGTIILTGLVSGFRSWNYAVKVKQTNVVLDLIENPEFPKGFLADELNLRDNAEAVTLLLAANAHQSAGEKQQARALFDQLASNSGAHEDLRMLGLLMGVRLLDMDEKQQASSDVLLEKLLPLLKDQNSPWHAYARMEAAVIERHMAGNFDAAQEHLNFIQDTQNIPETMRQKARALSALYRIEADKAIKDKAS